MEKNEKEKNSKQLETAQKDYEKVSQSEKENEGQQINTASHQEKLNNSPDEKDSGPNASQEKQAQNRRLLNQEEWIQEFQRQEGRPPKVKELLQAQLGGKVEGSQAGTSHRQAWNLTIEELKQGEVRSEETTQTWIKSTDGQVKSNFLKSTKLEALFSSLSDKQVKFLKIAAFLTYPLAYLMIWSLFDNPLNFHSIGFLPAILGAIGLLEGLCQVMGLTYKKLKEKGTAISEPIIFLILTLLQALGLSILRQPLPALNLEVIGPFQILALQITSALYVSSRTGWLAQGRLGLLVWYDWIKVSLILPFGNFLLRLRTLSQHRKVQDDKCQPSSQQERLKHWSYLIASLLFAGILVGFAWNQLGKVSSSFAQMGYQLLNFLSDVLLQILSLVQAFNFSTIFYVILSLPLGTWLFGLLAGSLLSNKSRKLTVEAFQEKRSPLQIFPAYTAYIIIASLCLIYTLFFTTALGDLGSLLSATKVEAYQASTVAVAGFWQLVRVALMNFFLLAIFYLLARKDFWKSWFSRLSLTILFGFTSLFALLAAWKLFGIYIALYGLTELRLLSGWFIPVLLVWCLLTLIELYKPIQAIRLGIFYALISFTLMTFIANFYLA